MLKVILILIVTVAFSLHTAAQPPKTAVNLYNNGKKLIGYGMYYEAIQSFKKAIALYKNYDSAYLVWSNLYTRMNKPDSAILVLNRAIKQNPKMLIAYTTLAQVYRDYKTNPDSARLYFSYALKLDSSNKELFYNIAWCYNAGMEYEKAISYSVKALDRDINYKPAYNEMAHAWHALKRYDEALVMFKKYAAVSTSDQPLFYSGMIYLELNQYDNLQKTIDELLKKGAKSPADGLQKRWDIKKNQKPAQGS